MIGEATIQEAANRLLRAAPGSTVILFGSRARGDAGEESDVDFIVIEPEVHKVQEEMVRLRDALEPMPLPADVLVISRDEFDEWSQRPGTVWYHALREGKQFRDQR